MGELSAFSTAAASAMSPSIRLPMALKSTASSASSSDSCTSTAGCAGRSMLRDLKVGSTGMTEALFFFGSAAAQLHRDLRGRFGAVGPHPAVFLCHGGLQRVARLAHGVLL